MSAQQSNPQTSSQTTSQGEQRGRQTSLARTGSTRSGLPALWTDPFETFANPFALFRRMQDEISRAFGQTGRGSGEELSTGMWVPAVDVEYRDGKLEVTAELPGLRENEVKVEVNNNLLTIQGERKIEHEENLGAMRRVERRYGQFYRTIPLPEGTEAENARAELQNGVLHVTIPVSQANVHQIPVRATGSQGERGSKAA